jgi:hypothetical protein
MAYEVKDNGSCSDIFMNALQTFQRKTSNSSGKENLLVVESWLILVALSYRVKYGHGDS